MNEALRTSHVVFVALFLVAIFRIATPLARADEACQAVLAARIRTCAQACIERAKAAVAPEIRDRVRGYGCTNNCVKLEMFNGNACPATRPKG